MLLAFPVYGGGQAIVTSGISSEDGPSSWYLLGCLLIVLNSMMVAVIGCLVYHQMLRLPRTISEGLASESESTIAVGQRRGLCYMLSRFGEATLLGIGGICYYQILQNDNERDGMTFTLQLAQTCYSLGMISLCLGSIPLLIFLCRVSPTCTTNIPQPICVLGIVGYTCLAIGSGVDISGCVEDFPESLVGVCMLLPGAVFELIFGIWVTVKGFRIECSGQASVAQLPSGLF